MKENHCDTLHNCMKCFASISRHLFSTSLWTAKNNSCSFTKVEKKRSHNDISHFEFRVFLWTTANRNPFNFNTLSFIFFFILFNSYSGCSFFSAIWSTMETLVVIRVKGNPLKSERKRTQQTQRTTVNSSDVRKFSSWFCFVSCFFFFFFCKNVYWEKRKPRIDKWTLKGI